MKKVTILVVLFVATLLIGTVQSQAQGLGGTGGLESMRGGQDLSEDSKVPTFKRWLQDQRPMKRSYLQQPPLIPHSIEGYRINLRQNKCLNCHSWRRYKDSGATKISLTHFRSRFGTELADVSPLRYFCTQCHASQRDARPLVDNTFKPVEAMTN
ncbi:MAG: nitrate reductase cytochrome c-type subunit [Magnetococcales bacterium]|nr:nitrate reductase cytochrome c-type subunit [Magnetococcales bacterium]